MCWWRPPRQPDPCQVYTQVFTLPRQPDIPQPEIRGTAMSTAQTEFTAEELLLSPDYTEPLVANGVRCHGGFDATGTYQSPRTRFRAPAIEAWEAPAPRTVLDADPRHPARVVARELPERRPDEVPAAQRRDRHDDLHAHAHRHGRRLRRDAAPDPHPRLPGPVRRGHPGYRGRSHRPRPVRGARARRGRPRGRGGPQRDVVHRTRHGVRQPRHRRPDQRHARAHGHRAVEDAKARARR